MPTLVNGYVLLPQPIDWSTPPTLTLQWQTEIAVAKRGYEDRASLRAKPQAQMTWTTVMRDPTGGAALEDDVRAALRSGQAAVPCWPRPSYVAATAGGGLTLTLEVGSRWPWQAGDYLFAVGADGTVGTPQVTAVNGLTLTLAAAIPATDTVCPLLFGRLGVERADQDDPDAVALNCRLYVNAWRLPATTTAPTVYAGVPVAPGVVAADWAKQVTRSFAYDQSVEQVGFGPETLLIEQSYVQHGLGMETWLGDEAALADVEAFFGALGGRRGGFWLPGAERAMLVTRLVSASRFLIQAQGLATTYDSQPDLYLYFRRDGYAPMIGRVSGVIVGVLPGTEQVTLREPLPVAVDPHWDVYRLRLMRLSDDRLKESYDADRDATVQVVAVELPLEYFSAPPDLAQPVYLYRFTARLDAAVNWYITSHSEPFVYQGNAYTPAPVSHADISRGVDSQDESVKVTSFFGPDNPLASYLPFPPSDRLQVTITRVDLQLPDPAAGAAVVFQGFIASVKMIGRKLEATVQSPLDFMARKLPGLIVGTPCNAQLFGPGCLGPDGRMAAANWAAAGQIAALVGPLLTLSGATGQPDNWFAAGHLTTGAGKTAETRTILASTGQTLVLSYPLLHAKAGQALTMYPGCSHLPGADGCGKFANFVNYQGHPLVPNENPTLKSIDTPQGSGKGG